MIWRDRILVLESKGLHGEDQLEGRVAPEIWDEY